MIYRLSYIVHRIADCTTCALYFSDNREPEDESKNSDSLRSVSKILKDMMFHCTLYASARCRLIERRSGGRTNGHLESEDSISDRDARIFEMSVCPPISSPSNLFIRRITEMSVCPKYNSLRVSIFPRSRFRADQNVVVL